jgi:hypothetical protein
MRHIWNRCKKLFKPFGPRERCAKCWCHCGFVIYDMLQIYKYLFYYLSLLSVCFKFCNKLFGNSELKNARTYFIWKRYGNHYKDGNEIVILKYFYLVSIKFLLWSVLVRLFTLHHCQNNIKGIKTYLDSQFQCFSAWLPNSLVSGLKWGRTSWWDKYRGAKLVTTQ